LPGAGAPVGISPARPTGGSIESWSDLLARCIGSRLPASVVV